MLTLATVWNLGRRHRKVAPLPTERRAWKYLRGGPGNETSFLVGFSEF